MIGFMKKWNEMNEWNDGKQPLLNCEVTNLMQSNTQPWKKDPVLCMFFLKKKKKIQMFSMYINIAYLKKKKKKSSL